MTAIQTLLAGFFDYAGLYPPASLSLRSAANNYLDYASGKHAPFLGRFIINADRLKELRSIAGDHLRQFKLSVILPNVDSFAAVSHEISNGMSIEAVEIKYSDPKTLEQTANAIPQSVAGYIEIPLDANAITALDPISRTGLRAKIRMGGVSAEAFPTPPAVIQMLSALAKIRLPFKATAGLHHPIRSTQPLTYNPRSATSTMHGFVNLCCAAAALYFGGNDHDAENILNGQDPSAFTVSENSIGWRHLTWSGDQLAMLRRDFFTGVGSCSFEEPVHDLEALGWL